MSNIDGLTLRKLGELDPHYRKVVNSGVRSILVPLKNNPEAPKLETAAQNSNGPRHSRDSKDSFDGCPGELAVFAICGTQNRAVFWPFGKRVMELLILDKKERVAESQ